MLRLYGHPFAAFAWKALIAAYERGVPFNFRMVDPDHPENMARIAELSPTGQFPALVDGDVEITGSNAVIAWLDRHGDAPPLIPADPREAIEARLLSAVLVGRFSSRDIVGCEHSSAPLSGRRPTAILKAGSSRKASQSLASS
jgi:glutathione S-transferase